MSNPPTLSAAIRSVNEQMHPGSTVPCPCVKLFLESGPLSTIRAALEFLAEKYHRDNIREENHDPHSYSGRIGCNNLRCIHNNAALAVLGAAANGGEGKGERNED